MFDQIGTGVAFFPISAYSFMESEEDGSFYQEKQRKMKAGLANLTSLETESDENLKKIGIMLKKAEEVAVNAIKSTFKEILENAEVQHQTLRTSLQQSRRNIEHFGREKSYELSQEDIAICLKPPSEPLLVGTLRDCMGTLRNTLMAHFDLIVMPESEVINHELLGSTSALLAAPEEEPNWFKSELLSLPNTVANSSELNLLIEASQTAEEYLIRGRTARESGDYENALADLKKAREAAANQGKEYPELNLQFALVYAYLGKREEAKGELLQGLSPHYNPQSPLSVQLQVELAGLYFQTGQWQDAIAISENTLQTWAKAVSNTEYLRLLYYISSSSNQLEQLEIGIAAVNRWMIGLNAENHVESSMMLLIQADRLKATEDTLNAIHNYEKGLNFVQLPYPYIVASAKLNLGSLYEEQKRVEEAEEQYRQAHTIYSRSFPHSLHYCMCLTKEATLYTHLNKKLKWALSQYTLACELYSAQFPESVEYADCLVDLGLCYERRKNRQMSEKPWKSACEIYAEKASLSIDYAECLYHLGDLYDDMKKFKKASKYWRKACTIYQIRAPESLELASCYNNLGFVYLKSLRKLELAEEYLLKASFIFSKIKPNSVQYANCLYNFAQVLKAMKQPQAAAKKLEEALELFKLNREDRDVERCEAGIKRLSK